MTFNLDGNEFLPEIFGILRSRRNEAEQSANERRIALRLEYPEFEAIDKELKQTGSSIYKILTDGNDIKEKMNALAQRNAELQKMRREFLQNHKLPENYLEPSYNCKLCSDTGYINGKYCSCVNEFVKSNVAKKLNAASPLTVSTFELFDINLIPNVGSTRRHMDLICKHLKQYAKDFSKESPSLFLYGATGLGKTHLSLAVANEVMEKGFNVVYGSAPMLFQKIADERFERFDRFGTENTENTLIHCDLLIFDDLGAEMITQLSQASLYNIINTRISLKRPTIINSNIDIDKLDTYYHQRIVSRLAFSFEPIPFVGRDMRQIAKTL